MQIIKTLIKIIKTGIKIVYAIFLLTALLTTISILSGNDILSKNILYISFLFLYCSPIIFYFAKKKFSFWKSLSICFYYATLLSLFSLFFPYSEQYREYQKTCQLQQEAKTVLEESIKETASLKSIEEAASLETQQENNINNTHDINHSINKNSDIDNSTEPANKINTTENSTTTTNSTIENTNKATITKAEIKTDDTTQIKSCISDEPKEITEQESEKTTLSETELQQSLKDIQYYADLQKEWFDKFLDSYEKRVAYCQTTDFFCSKDGYMLEIDYVFNKTDLNISDPFVFDWSYKNGKQEFEITWLYKKDSEHQVRNKELIFNENYINEIEVLFIDNMEHFSKRMKEITGLENEVVFYLCSTKHYITVSSKDL